MAKQKRDAKPVDMVFLFGMPIVVVILWAIASALVQPMP